MVIHGKKDRDMRCVKLVGRGRVLDIRKERGPLPPYQGPAGETDGYLGTILG